MLVVVMIGVWCYEFVFLDCCVFFFFKQKTAYEMRISDWSSDVCSSDLQPFHLRDVAEDEMAVAVAPVEVSRTDFGIDDQHALRMAGADKIGRASCRERVCQYV